MAKTHHVLAAAALLVLAAGIQAGPAEVRALRDELATIDARISETEALMKNALSGYGDDAGQYGIELRTLKRERAQIDQNLKKATDGQRKRSPSSQDASVIQTDSRVINRRLHITE